MHTDAHMHVAQPTTAITARLEQKKMEPVQESGIDVMASGERVPVLLPASASKSLDILLAFGLMTQACDVVGLVGSELWKLDTRRTPVAGKLAVHVTLQCRSETEAWPARELSIKRCTNSACLAH